MNSLNASPEIRGGTRYIQRWSRGIPG